MTRTGNWKKFREALNGSKHDRLKQRHTFFCSTGDEDVFGFETSLRNAESPISFSDGFTTMEPRNCGFIDLSGGGEEGVTLMISFFSGSFFSPCCLRSSRTI